MVRRSILAIALVIVIVVGLGAYVISDTMSVPPSTSTSVPFSLSSNTNATGSSSTSSTTLGETTPVTTITTNPPANETLVSKCSGATTPSRGFGTVNVGTTSSGLICVQLYYYDLNATRTLNVTGLVSIRAIQYIANGSNQVPRSFSGDSNFAITASQAQVTLGGPNGENEGTIVAYTITAKPGASGTYQLGFVGSLSTYLLSQEPESCGDYGQLTAGNGMPNYAQPAVTCITYDIYNSSSCVADADMSCTSVNSFTISGITYPLLSGDVYFKVVGVTNSTR